MTAFSALALLLINISMISCGQMSYELNPNCEQYVKCKQSSKKTNVVLIRSNGDNDTINFLWSTMTGVPPTLVVFTTKPNTSVSIDWNQLLSKGRDVSNAIGLSSDPINAIGLEMSRLFFFNDLNTTGVYDINYPILEVNWDDLVWKSAKNSINSNSDSVSTRFTQDRDDKFNNGTIDLDLSVVSKESRSDDLPHLAFNQLSTYFQLSVTDVITENSILFNDTNRPRLVAQFLVVNEGLKKDDNFERITSIDDEYTPGVFDRVILKLNSKEDQSQPKKSFVQWKPIAYTSSERIIANTIDVIHTNVDHDQQISDNSLILKAFFSNRSHTCFSYNLTFGSSDDTDYYDSKKFNSFSLVIGLDSPPDEKLSFLVQMIILVGFGLPLLVMIVSALYLIVRKIRKRNYDDLLLSQESIDQSRVIS